VVITNVQKQFAPVVVRCIVIASLFVESWILINPANLERLFFLFIVLGGILATSNMKQFRGEIEVSKAGLLIVLFFVIWSGIVILVSESDVPQQVYGIYGRNSGFALYLGLAILAVITSSVKSRFFSKQLVLGLFVCGLISTVYGFLQKLNLDLLGWDVDRQVTGLLGNSNFQSSFLGMYSIAVFALIVFPSSIKVHANYLMISLGLSLVVIYFTNSIQGFFVFVVGVTVVILIKILMQSSKRLKMVTSSTVMLIGSFSVLGIAGIGPLARALNFKTIELREFYWVSGIEMVRESPFFGSGFDVYGDLYRVFRSPSSIVEFGPELASNAAHNVFIDIAVNGGLPLLFLYLLLIVFTFNRAIIVLKRQREIDPFFVSIFASWIGYLSQLFVSMNQVSIAIWGWSLMGALIGYERFTRVSEDESPKKDRQKSKADFGIDPSFFMRFLGGALIGFLLMLPPFLGEAKFRSALQSSNGEQIRLAALAWPRNPVFMVKATEIFRDNQLQKDALDMALKTTDQFPGSIYAWRTLLTLENLDPSLKEKAELKLKELDPLNKDYQ
jgi:O-antigen ligase